MASGRCAGHPAVLAFSVGNEILSGSSAGTELPAWRPSSSGSPTRFARRDPGALVTYVNYPTTEYLRVRGLDYESWNVYLEQHDAYERYVARLQNLAHDRPVVIAELGADSRRKGVDVQAEPIGTQVRATFAAGASGTFVFAWTDNASGVPVDDWDFGVTTREREPKPALAA